MTDVKVLDEGKVRSFRKVSPLGRALQTRQVSEWIVMVATSSEHRREVAKAADRILFG